MGTILYYQPIASSSSSHEFNETVMDYGNQNSSSSIDQSMHLFSLIAIWIILLVTIIFGATGNVLVLYVYANRKDNKTCTFFIKVLAIVDLTICAILAPLELYQVTIGKHQRFFAWKERGTHRSICLGIHRYERCSASAERESEIFYVYSRLMFLISEEERLSANERRRIRMPLVARRLPWALN